SQEPSGMSDAAGNFTILDAGDVAMKPLLAIVSTASLDAELGAVTKPFIMIAPAREQALINPFTTLLWNAMREGGLSLTEADATIQRYFSLKESALTLDYTTRSDPVAQLWARAIAASIALNTEALQSISGLSQQLGEANFLRAVLGETQKTLLPVLAATSGAPQSVSCANPCTFASLLSKLAPLLSAPLTQLKTEAPRLVARYSSTIPMVQTLAEGQRFVILNRGSGDYLNAQGERVSGSSAGLPGYTKELQATSFEIGAATVTAVESVRLAQSWRRPYRYATTEWIWAQDRWVSQATTSAGYRSGQIRIENGCLIRSDVSSGQLLNRQCAQSRLVGGKTIKEVFPSLCLPSAGAAQSTQIPGCDSKLPSDATVIEFMTTWPNAFIRLLAHNDRQFAGLPYEGFPGQAPSLDRFLRNASTYTQWLGARCDIGFRIKASSNDLKHGQIEWGNNISAGGCDLFARVAWTTAPVSSAYRVELKPGPSGSLREVMLAAAPAMVRSLLGSELLEGCELAFSVVSAPNAKAGVYLGQACPGGTTERVAFDGGLSESATYAMPSQQFDLMAKALGWQPLCTASQSSC
ncbi:MAG: hypothetical protein EB069_07910, partial [Actinobacteria bacterium]|nr:hypothetical protein [Actinomycetota bacterium]